MSEEFSGHSGAAIPFSCMLCFVLIAGFVIYSNQDSRRSEDQLIAEGYLEAKFSVPYYISYQIDGITYTNTYYNYFVKFCGNDTIYSIDWIADLEVGNYYEFWSQQGMIEVTAPNNSTGGCTNA